MIYLVSGSDKYRKNLQLSKIIQTANDVSGSNVSRLDGFQKLGDLQNEYSSTPFLADKRIVVLNNFLKNGQKDLQKEVSSWLQGAESGSNDLVFWEDEDPDQRTSLYKTLTKVGKVHVFGNLKPFEIVNYIKEYVSSHQGTIQTDAANLLQIYCGNDLERINNEIEKLLSYDTNITKENVEKLVDPGYFNTIFDLTDSLAQKNPKKGLHCIGGVLDSGENAAYIVSMLAMQVRNMIMVKDLASHRLSEQEIVNRSKLHPFVVKKTLSQVNNFTEDRLVRMHKELMTIDLKLKTSQGDPALFLEKFVIENSR